jgi:hypothetical protein
MHRPRVLTSKVLGIGFEISNKKLKGWIGGPKVYYELAFSGCIMVEINVNLLMKYGTTKG